MRTEPTDLSATDVVRELASHWGIDTATLIYAPLGFGSHHWRAVGLDGREWFVTVDDHRDGRTGFPAATLVDGLGRALRTAATLRDRAGLPFVHASVSDLTGEMVHRIARTPYSVAVFPFVAAEPVGPGPYPDEADRRAVLGMVGRIHAATTLVPEGLPRREDLAGAGRDDLLAVMRQLDEPWRAGPYGEPTRLLLREHRVSIERVLAAFDRLIVPILGDQSGWVVTHSEPHARNVLRYGEGRLLLVDWDTVAIGPRERDLWMLLPESGPADRSAYTAYTAETGVESVAEGTIRAFRMRWDLWEIASYVRWFREPHEATADSEIAWSGLSGTFPLSPDYLVTGTPGGPAPR